MKFLIDEDLPKSLEELFREFGLNAYHIRSIGMKGKKDREIASFAKKNNMIIVTGDYDFSDVRNYPPYEYPGIIVIELPRDATATFINKQFRWFLKQTHIIRNISKKLTILEPGRIRIRNS